MKFKRFMSCVLLASLVCLGAADATAQRKSTAKKTTTTARKTSSTSSKTATPAAFSAKKLENSRYFSIAQVDANSYLFQWLNFKSNKEVLWVNYEEDGDLEWVVNGNSLKIGLNGTYLFNLSTKDGGESFSGSMNGHNCYLYNITRSKGQPFSAASQKDLVAGKYKAFLGIQKYNGKPIVGFPVTAKFTKDVDDPQSGSFKITGDSKLLAGLGALKFDYTFGSDAMVVSTIDNGEDRVNYGDFNNNYVILKLGRHSKTGTLYLYLVKL